jgi:short subunit dehydrogenase-like uncharacterized protein
MKANGFVKFFGTITAGLHLRARITGDRDPGYGSTARMLGEAGACLAMDVSKSALIPRDGVLLISYQPAIDHSS